MRDLPVIRSDGELFMTRLSPSFHPVSNRPATATRTPEDLTQELLVPTGGYSWPVLSAGRGRLVDWKDPAAQQWFWRQDR